ncbi:MAG: type II toxin-antitoxin system CcdA family antitoxin [Pseudomonadota bacterium]
MNNQIRKRTNVTLDADLIERARALDVNLSRAAEAGVADAVRRADREQWVRENGPKMQAWGKWVEENELPLAKYRMF